jgi:Kef-type K+ transport system membrane component KefB
VFFMPIVLASEASAGGPQILAAVLLSLLVIYVASKAGGEIGVRIGLPAVLGELVAGVLVGVSVLGLLVFPGEGVSTSGVMEFIRWTAGMNPDQAQQVFQVQGEVLNVLSELGVIILLFEVGLESDLRALFKVGPQAATVAVVGVTVPFALGAGALLLLFKVPLIAAVFAGAALTATSIGITARVLSDLNRLNSTEGQIIVGAAILDDILGIIILAVVVGLADRGEVSIGRIAYVTVAAGGFLIGAIFIGRLTAPFFLWLVKRLRTRGDLLISSLVFAFALALVANVIGSEAILGAFAAGAVLAETDKGEDLKLQLKPVADVFIPIFFVAVGAKTNLGVLNPAIEANREGLIIASVLVIIAILGKVVAGYAAFGGGINRLAVGVGMIPRGEVGLVFAGVGASSGVLSPALDAALIVMVIITTFIAPPLLRIVFQREIPSGKREL